MSAIVYQNLALRWSPRDKTDHTFNLILLVVMVIFMSTGAYLSTLEVPVKKRDAEVIIPERIARYIQQRPKPPPPPPPVIEKPKPPPPPPPDIKVDRPKQPDKPLTKAQQDARKRAEQSGLMAHMRELAALMDTADARNIGQVNKPGNAATQAATVDSNILTRSGDGKGSGGVSEGTHVASVSRTQLDDAQRAAARQQLLSGPGLSDTAGTGKDKSKSSGSASGVDARTEEDIVYVIDQHKSVLHSIYRRARRVNPNLKGKIVIELTVLPSGKVSAAVIKQSELNDSSLENSIIARIKQLDFGERKGGPLTVTIPVEFLPS